ncbi:MAG: GH39 family glycosyl hydrolase [Anaerolineae bacterium]
MKNLIRSLVIVLVCAGCVGGPLVVKPDATPAGGPVVGTDPAPSATEPADPESSATPTQRPATLAPTSTVDIGTPTPTPRPTPTLEPLVPLSVSIDYNSVQGPLDTSKLLNGAVGGYAPMENYNWLPDAYDELAAIGMELIRLDHTTDDAFYEVVWRSSDGELQYDFSRLNRVVIPILQSGMAPLLSLCYKPDALAPEGSEKQPPADMGVWTEVVTTYVEHFKAAGYTGLHWEVWNEPDLAFFFQASAQQYVDLYVTTAQAIKRADPTARVGGAADSSASSPEGKLAPLLAYIKEHPEVPLDFVSYHDYADPDGDGASPFILSWHVETIEALMADANVADRDIYVTEWNLTPRMTTGPGADTDTNVGAAAVAARLAYVLDHPSIKRVFYFSPIEGYAPDRIFNGDLGLLTVNYHKKALYYLFQMVSGLGDTRLAVAVGGENTEGRESYALATRKGDDQETAVLVWNYWDVARTLELSLDGLPYEASGNNVLVTRYLIDADHANYYKDYSAGLRGYRVGPSELLLPVESSVTTPTSTFSRRIALPPYSVVLVTLTPTDHAPTPGPVVTPPPPLPRNYAADRAVNAATTLEHEGWHPGALVDEITHSLPSVLGWSSQLHESPDTETWVTIDLGEPVRVDTVKLYPRDDRGYEGAGFPVDFAIQGSSDGEAWVDLVVQTAYEPQGHPRDVQPFTFPAGHYRAIRLIARRLGAVEGQGYALQLAEMEVFGEANSTGQSP